MPLVLLFFNKSYRNTSSTFCDFLVFEIFGSQWRTISQPALCILALQIYDPFKAFIQDIENKIPLKPNFFL